MLPKNRPPTHPGEMLLKEFLEPLGVTQVLFARHLGWTFEPSHLCRAAYYTGAHFFGDKISSAILPTIRSFDDSVTDDFEAVTRK